MIKQSIKQIISRRKIKILCGSAYITIIGLVDPHALYLTYDLFTFYACFFTFPLIFLTVTYYIIARALIKQRKALRAFSNATQPHLHAILYHIKFSKIYLEFENIFCLCNNGSLFFNWSYLFMTAFLH